MVSLKKNFQPFRRWLLDPMSTGEDVRRREYILNIVLVGSIIMLLALDAVVLYYSIHLGANDHGISFWAFSMIPAFFIFLLVLSRHGRFATASYLVVAAYFLSDSYATLRWTFDMPPTLLGYAVIIMVSSVLVNTRFGFFMTGLIGAFLIPVSYLQIHGLIASDPSWESNLNATDAIVFLALFFLIMVIAWLSNRETERSLTRARRSEKELKNQRDLLEVKVEERTQELQKTQFEKIEQINQFAEFGQLASGLFHDMLNIMNTLSMKLDLQSEGNVAKQIEHGLSPHNASLATKQIEQFTQAIRKQLNHQEASEAFSLEENIDQVIQLLSYKAHQENVRIVFDPKARIGIEYFGNPFKFHQVIFNLIANGIESYAKLPRVAGNERDVVVHVEERGNDITIRVKDQGCGMPEEIQGKIFEPFFSTKEEQKATGIGLASVKKIVEKDLLGTISVRSKINQGSLFTIAFPKKKNAV